MANAKEVKSHLKSYGIKPSALRVTCDPSINIRVIDLTVDLKKVREVSAQKFESISRCSYTNEILQGGNTYVFAKYCEKSLYSHYCNDKIEKFLKKHIPDRYDPKCRIHWVAEQLSKEDQFLGSINIQAKQLVYREILSSLKRNGQITLEY